MSRMSGEHKYLRKKKIYLPYFDRVSPEDSILSPIKIIDLTIKSNKAGDTGDTGDNKVTIDNKSKS